MNNLEGQQGEMETVRIETETTRGLRSKQASRRERAFVKGPIPMAWLSQSVSWHRAGLAVLLWIKRGMDVGSTPFVRVGQRCENDLGLTPDQRRDAIASLERAGVIRVERNPGSAPIVSMIEAKGGGK